MGIHEETTYTSGFSGFVPSLSTKFGMTFGNATREILRTDPYLKKGEIQQSFTKRHQKRPPSVQDIDTEIWKSSGQAVGDDRFSFPPVPGYTGFIPRSRDHFGKAFVETTAESILEFKKMLQAKNTIPPKILAIQKNRLDAVKTNKHEEKKIINSLDPFVGASMEEKSPYKLPKNDPKKTFISGYTGYVPRLQNHFGEPYSHSVRRAIEEFGESSVRKQASTQIKLTSSKPIPGFTGFIPGSRTLFSMSFGRSSEAAYENFKHRDEQGYT